MNRGAENYSIRQVVDLTGISEFTLRGWENRYHAFKPSRTDTGRRKYSTEDLQKAILLRELLLRDHRIGQIAQLPPRELQRLLEEKPPETRNVPGPFASQVDSTLRALSLQDWDELENQLRRTGRHEKPMTVLAEFIAPLVQELGRRVALGTVSIAQEHVFSSLLKERLYVIRGEAKKSHRAARFVVAAPEGDHHELGILIAHAMLVLSGIRSVYLGPNTPKKDLCETALRFGASHVLLGSTTSRKEGAKEELHSFLHFLDQHLRRDTAVWVGGRNAAGPLGALAREVVGYPSLWEFERGLRYVE